MRHSYMLMRPWYRALCHCMLMRMCHCLSEPSLLVLAPTAAAFMPTRWTSAAAFPSAIWTRSTRLAPRAPSPGTPPCRPWTCAARTASPVATSATLHVSMLTRPHRHASTCSSACTHVHQLQVSTHLMPAAGTCTAAHTLVLGVCRI